MVGQVVDPHVFAVTTGHANGGAAQTLLAVDKHATSLTQGSPVQVTGRLQPAFSTEAAQVFTGGNLGNAALTAYNGKPYVQAMVIGPVSANLTRGQGGIFGIGSSGCGSANQVVKNMQSYTGQQVTMTGAVGQVVGPHAFTLIASGNAQGARPQAVLAVTKETTPLTQGSPVQVTGRLQPAFSTEAAQAFTGGNLGNAALTAYNGKPYVQAMVIGPVSANLSGGQGAG
jgi:phage gpG-like protein